MSKNTTSETTSTEEDASIPNIRIWLNIFIQQPETKQTYKQFLVEGQWVTKEEKTNNLEKCSIKLQFMMIVLILCNIIDKKGI